jgi:hypothetical protein
MDIGFTKWQKRKCLPHATCKFPRRIIVIFRLINWQLFNAIFPYHPLFSKSALSFTNHFYIYANK